jgi:UDP-glucose 4-epimerase
MTLDQPNSDESNPDKQQRSILVTGGAGFIGSHLVDRLLAQGDSVTVIDDMSTGLRTNLPQEHELLNVITGTVSESLGSIDIDVDVIFHLAAAVGVKLVVDEPIRTIETNVLETSEILRFASLHNTPILLASTSEVYGKSTAIPMQEEGDLVFGATTKSRWSYGCSKALDEHLAMAWFNREGVPVRIPRLFNTIGPRQRGGLGMVVPRFVKAAMNNQPLVVYGDGLQTRCFCDVRDTVPMLLDLMGTNKSIGLVVNVGSNEPITIMKLAELVRSTLKSKSTIECISMDDAYGEGFEDLQVRQPDLERIVSLVGDRSRIPLQDTILSIAESRSFSIEK